MKVVLQRVKEAKVTIQDQIIGQIGYGLLIFVGFTKDDNEKDINFLVRKIIDLRIFEDDEGKMNRSSLQVKAQFLVVSQFTLLGDCQKGRRPSFDQAALPKPAEKLYNCFVEKLKMHQLKVETGQFRAMMEVALINDGPVTFILES